MVHRTEKELYRIFKELELHSRTTFSYSDSGKQQSIARSLGQRGKPFIRRGLFLPPARARDHSLNIVALPIGVTVEEKKPNRFFFQRK